MRWHIQAGVEPWRSVKLRSPLLLSFRNTPAYLFFNCLLMSFVCRLLRCASQGETHNFQVLVVCSSVVSGASAVYSCVEQRWKLVSRLWVMGQMVRHF